MCFDVSADVTCWECSAVRGATRMQCHKLLQPMRWNGGLDNSLYFLCSVASKYLWLLNSIAPYVIEGKSFSCFIGVLLPKGNNLYLHMFTQHQLHHTLTYYQYIQLPHTPGSKEEAMTSSGNLSKNLQSTPLVTFTCFDSPVNYNIYGNIRVLPTCHGSPLIFFPLWICFQIS